MSAEFDPEKTTPNQSNVKMTRSFRLKQLNRQGQHLHRRRNRHRATRGAPLFSGGWTGFKASCATMLPYLGQGLRVTAAAGAGLVLTGFVAARIYDRIYVSHPTGASFVSAETTVLSAPATGQLSYFNANAAKGEPAFTVLRDDGRTISVDLPCDCKLMAPIASEGSRVFAGMPVAEAVGKDSKVYVTAELDSESLMMLYRNPRILITLADGETLKAEVRNLPRVSSLALDRSGTVPVKFKTVVDLTPADIGKPAQLTFDTFPLNLHSVPKALTFLGFGTNRETAASDQAPSETKTDRETAWRRS